MREDLWRSIYYLHMQPPGFNLAVGLVVKLFPNSYEAILHSFFLLMGLGIAFLMLDTLRLFGIAEWGRILLTALFIASPGCVLYEDCLIYDYPVALLLLAALAFLLRFASSPSLATSLGFFLSLLSLLLIRNMFHLGLIFLAGIAGWMLFTKSRRWVVVGALPALLLGTGLYFKNWIEFGAFTGSTWLGMQLGVTTTYQLTNDEADDLIRTAGLNPIARITPFSRLDQYAGYYKPVPKTGIPVLDEPNASLHANYNDLDYLQIHRQYAEAAKVVLLHRPQAYLRALAIAGYTYLLPPGDVHTFDKDRAKMGTLDRYFSLIFFGQLRQVNDRKELRRMYAQGERFSLLLYTGVFLVVLLPVLLLWAAAQLLIPRLRRSWKREHLIALGFILFILVLVTASANLLSSFENNRYRFPVDSFFLILLALCVQRRFFSAAAATESGS
jgi:hypothetical protein